MSTRMWAVTIVAVLGFFCVYIPYQNTGDRRIVAEIEDAIDESCGTFTGCKVEQGYVRCWTEDVSGGYVYTDYEYPDERPDSTTVDWICRKAKEVNI